MHEFRTQCLSGDLVRCDPEIIEQIISVVRASYVDPQPLIENDLARATQIYLAFDSSNQVAAFFMIAREELSIANCKQNAVFLGWSGATLAARGTKAVHALYAEAAHDIRTWEAAADSEFILWFTTATPSAYYGASLFWDIEPAADGEANQRSVEAARAITAQFGFRSRTSPFSLAGAYVTRYSHAERERIKMIEQRRSFNLFRLLDIDESRGDRLLVIARSRNRQAAH
jgi:hypothetical protein